MFKFFPRGRETGQNRPMLKQCMWLLSVVVEVVVEVLVLRRQLPVWVVAVVVVAQSRQKCLMLLIWVQQSRMLSVHQALRVLQQVWVARAETQHLVRHLCLQVVVAVERRDLRQRLVLAVVAAVPQEWVPRVLGQLQSLVGYRGLLLLLRWGAQETKGLLLLRGMLNTVVAVAAEARQLRVLVAWVAPRCMAPAVGAPAVGWLWQTLLLRGASAVELVLLLPVVVPQQVPAVPRVHPAVQVLLLQAIVLGTVAEGEGEIAQQLRARPAVRAVRRVVVVVVVEQVSRLVLVVAQAVLVK